MQFAVEQQSRKALLARERARARRLRWFLPSINFHYPLRHLRHFVTIIYRSHTRPSRLKCWRLAVVTPPPPTIGGIEQCCDPSVCPSVPYPEFKNGTFTATVEHKPKLEVEPTVVSVAVRPPEVAEAATKPSPAPFQKHSSGGCTDDMPCRTAIAAGHVVSTCNTYLLMDGLS